MMTSFSVDDIEVTEILVVELDELELELELELSVVVVVLDELSLDELSVVVVELELDSLVSSSCETTVYSSVKWNTVLRPVETDLWKYWWILMYNSEVSTSLNLVIICFSIWVIVVASQV
jgi:hypothetical protein